MRVAALVPALVLWSTGCFYVEPINQRPSLDIRPASSAPVHRGGTVELHAVASDPERQVVRFQWRVYLCTDATVFETCDLNPWFSGIEDRATFHVPSYREAGEPVESLWIVLEGSDDRGAEARPRQELVLPVVNAAPTLEVSKSSAFGYVVGEPVELYARYGDPDDALDGLTVEWTAYSPSQVPFTLDPLAVPPDPDPTKRQVGRRLVPPVTGEWDIRVVATDPLGGQTERQLLVAVVEDRPPCLGALDPVPAPDGAARPIFEPTLIQVQRVEDDRDVYPEVAGHGRAEFRWSIRPPGAPGHQPLATSSNNVAFDPAAYPPGSIVELRVEIFDRNAAPVACPASEPTCSIAPSPPGCLQRQTWRLEAR